MITLLLLCGALSGVTTVLFGFGGGFFTVPLIYALMSAQYGADSPTGLAAMQIAVATSTCVMIFSAGLSTLHHHRAGSLDWRSVQPLVVGIVPGAALGAACAIGLNGDLVRYAFIAYLLVTIADCLLRPGFLRRAPDSSQQVSGGATAGIGVIIGLIAALLGVGGSVMTVPLMRRRGASMTGATAMANPLSLPMAVIGTLVWLGMARHLPGTGGPGFIGAINLRAALLLAAGAWVGISLTSRFIGRLPDAAHARIYPLLLALVTVVMVVAG